MKILFNPHTVLSIPRIAKPPLAPGARKISPQRQRSPLRQQSPQRDRSPGTIKTNIKEIAIESVRKPGNTNTTEESCVTPLPDSAPVSPTQEQINCFAEEVILSPTTILPRVMTRDRAMVHLTLIDQKMRLESNFL